jgi:hypothetical protein
MIPAGVTREYENFTLRSLPQTQGPPLCHAETRILQGSWRKVNHAMLRAAINSLWRRYTAAAPPVIARLDNMQLTHGHIRG